MQEKIIQTKNCKQCNTSFDITDKDLEFYEKVSPVFGGEKYNIPTPILCPDCRQQRRLAFRNERKLYKRKCDLTGKDIVSIYSPDKVFKVYDQKEWWGDKWDELSFGKDFDFSKIFFEQLDNLVKEVPFSSLIQKGVYNSNFGNDIEDTQDSYFIFNGAFSKDMYYVDAFLDSRSCFDCDWIIDNCELCYDSYKLEKCYKNFSCFFCSDSSNMMFCYDCHGCSDCILSTNLVNKKFYVLDEYVGKEKFQEYFSNLSSKDYKEMKEKQKEIIIKCIHKDLRTKNVENCFGDNIVNSKNSEYVFDCFNLEDGKYAWNCSGQYVFDCYNSGNTGFLLYDSIASYMVKDILFSSHLIYSNSILYSIYLVNCNNCFGCVGLKNKQYCILNKQYTKEEYEKVVPKIIEYMRKTGEWGEFFPASISPFGYNETVANEYFPLTKEEILNPSQPSLTLGKEQKDFSFGYEGEMSEGQRGLLHGAIFNWSTYEPPFPKVEKIISADKLPDDIKDIPDDILNWAIECEVTKKLFRIIKQELDFYRKHNLPIPRRHPDQRHLDRMKLRNPRKLYDRTCDKCGKDIKTTYAPERPKIVYCEECYNKEVY